MENLIRLLVLEDDEVDRIRLRHAFRTRESEISLTEVRSVAEAREAMAHSNFDCALVDLHLPDGSGLDLIQELGTTPAVILTGLDDDAVSKNALARGAQDYITKTNIDSRALWRSIQYAVERRNAESLRSRLQQTDRLAALGRVAASVAHEINNPNAFIAANLHLLNNETGRWAALLKALEQRAEVDASLAHLLREHEAESFGKDLDDLIEDCLEGVRRVTGLVRQMQTFSRQDGDEATVSVDLNDVIVRSLQFLRLHTDESVQADLHLDGELPVCQVRQNQLIQVMTNVVDNARQAAAEGDGAAKIQISTAILRAPHAGVRVTVDDSGGGIPQELRGKVFDPFFTTKPVGEGTGLGLSIVREIVRQHAGELTILDGPLGGARIQIDIPIGGSEPNAPEVEDMPEDLPETTSCRLLVIDDEPSVLRALRRLLAPHSVVCASGSEAMLLLEADQDFDAIICDVMMPTVDGVAIFESLEVHAPDAARRLIFHTGGAVSVRATALLARVKNPVLEKPASRKEILSAVVAVVADATNDHDLSDALVHLPA